MAVKVCTYRNGLQTAFFSKESFCFSILNSEQEVTRRQKNMWSLAVFGQICVVKMRTNQTSGWIKYSFCASAVEDFEFKEWEPNYKNCE